MDDNKPVRTRIKEAFTEFGRMNSWELAAVLDMDLKPVTSHISKLCQIGILERVEKTSAGGARGRKLVLYDLKERGK